MLRDVELLQQEVAHFHEKLESIKTQVIKVEKDTVSSLEQLIKQPDALKLALSHQKFPFFQFDLLVDEVLVVVARGVQLQKISRLLKARL